MAKVGVWMTNYGNEQFLTRAIDSVLKQSFTDFELLFTDNHSPSGEPNMVAAGYASDDERVVVLDTPDLDRKGIPHMRWVWDTVLGDRGYEYTILIGGHDFWNGPEFLGKMVSTMDLARASWQQADGDISLVYPDTWQVNNAGEACGRYADIMQIGQIPWMVRPLYVINGCNSPQAYGLWNEAVRRKIAVRHACSGWDHLVVAEASLHGQILFEPAAQLVMLAPGEGASMDQYGAKHLAKEKREGGMQDFCDQLEWVQELARQAAAKERLDAHSSMLLTASMVSNYMLLRGYNLLAAPGAMQEFGTDERVRQIMGAAHHIARQAADLCVRSQNEATTVA